MTERPVSQIFQDILETIAYLEGFTNGVSFEAFEANPEKLFAVVKAIEIIGEAVKKFLMKPAVNILSSLGRILLK
jgi:uncharacterized protein with HEPN domain